MGFQWPLCSFLLLLFHLVSAERYFLPLAKDTDKNQLYTNSLVGTPPVPVHMVVDLGNRFSWLACHHAGYYNSSTYGFIDCYQYWFCFKCIKCRGPATPTCNFNSCRVGAYTPWNVKDDHGLIYDTISLKSTSAKPASVPQFWFACTGKGLLKGLSRLAQGVFSLGDHPTALHNALSKSLKVPHKFALCAPSSSGAKGAIYFGGGPYILPPRGVDLSKYLVTTSIVRNLHSTAPIYFLDEYSTDYFINLRSIKIDATTVKFNTSILSFDEEGNGGTMISTIHPYTNLHSHIYKPLVDLFFSKAVALKIEKVPPVAPFGACFNSRSIRYNAKTGKGLPIIDLVFNEKSELLHGKNARWRIYGSNSMVRVAKDVECLAFVDGGPSTMAPITIGAKQLEDNLVEFDLEAGRLGFTSSLLRLGTSCSHAR